MGKLKKSHLNFALNLYHEVKTTILKTRTEWLVQLEPDPYQFGSILYNYILKKFQKYCVKLSILKSKIIKISNFINFLNYFYLFTHNTQSFTIFIHT